MYNEFIQTLPICKKYDEKFLIKGLKLPLSDSENTIYNIVNQYYLKRENVLVFAPPLSGKLTAIFEITKELENYIVLTGKETIDDFNNEHINVMLCDSFDFGNNSYDFIIFYQVEIPFSKIINYHNVHLSGFFEYTDLYNEKSLIEYISNYTSDLPDNFIFTTISKCPRNRTIQFLFGTSDDIKHLSVQGISQGMCFLYSKAVFNQLQMDYFKNQNIKVIDTIPDNIKADKLIFYDLNLDLIIFGISRIENVYIIYTKSEFDEVVKIVEKIEEKGLNSYIVGKLIKES